MNNKYLKFILGFLLGVPVFYYLAKFDIWEALTISFFASLLASVVWAKKEKN